MPGRGLRHGRRSWISSALLAAVVVVAALLYAVMLVHAAGQSMLALTLLAIGALAVWTYTSPRTAALRYLFPGVAAALVFVVFPMLYTVAMGFTNASSRNLLDVDRARALLLAETVQAPDSSRPFTLHRQGDLWRVSVAGSGGQRWASPAFAEGATPQQLPLIAQDQLGEAENLKQVVALLPTLRVLTLVAPDGVELKLTTLREFAQTQALYTVAADGALVDRATQRRYIPNRDSGFFESTDHEQLLPGFRVPVGWAHYERLVKDERFREPFLPVFVWTTAFAAFSVAGAAGLGLLLAVLLNWAPLRGKRIYRLVMFLPYAVPGFISILIFKGLFNQNLGEVNQVLQALFGIQPAWFSDPTLARAMLLIVNVWLGFPYMMILCAGLIQSIPQDLYEASAVAGAGPLDNFFKITAPLIVKPLTPLLIAAFAFNFNNFVLISLLTGGRPDQLDAAIPVGTTDLLVTYTWRIAFQDSGQQFGLAAAISTVIFLIVAGVTLVQLRLSRN
jgi:maltose/maltodextrin transport system permease protein